MKPFAGRNRYENNFVMKKTPIFFLACIAMAAAACREPAADGLTFEVSDPVSPVVAVVCHNDVREIILDSLGRGHYAFTGGDAAYLRIFYGRDSRTVYVENGDRAVISFAGNDFNDSFGIDDIEEMSGIYKKYVTDPARTAEFDAAYWKWFNKGKKPAL